MNIEHNNTNLTYRWTFPFIFWCLQFSYFLCQNLKCIFNSRCISNKSWCEETHIHLIENVEYIPFEVVFDEFLSQRLHDVGHNSQDLDLFVEYNSSYPYLLYLHDSLYLHIVVGHHFQILYNAAEHDSRCIQLYVQPLNLMHCKIITSGPNFFYVL